VTANAEALLTINREVPRAIYLPTYPGGASFTKEGTQMETFELLWHALVAALLVEAVLKALKGYAKKKGSK
jgi:hypothetical protein